MGEVMEEEVMEEVMGGRHSSVNGVRMSKRPFINSNRYRYRKMGGGYGYIYANREPGRMSVASFCFFYLVPVSVFICRNICCYVGSISEWNI